MGLRSEKSLKWNITRVLAANFWVAMIGFLGSFIFPKILTIEAYALYHTFTLYVGYIAICHLGFPSGMVINYAGQDYQNISASRYKSEMRLLLSILLMFTVAFLVIFLITGNKMILYIALAVVPTGLTGSCKALYQAWNRFKTFSRVSTFIATSIPLLALLYYIITKNLPGEIYIYIYLVIYWIVTIVMLYGLYKKVHGVKSEKIFSKENWSTEKTGIVIVIGNYINTLFVSADKQFVSWFFGKNEFAYYSFGMSMQALMTVFITSISQPLFPAMAQEKFKDEEYNSVKHALFVFGSISGCAYFAASIIVKLFIQKYIPSLEVVGIYFAVFPAMAVINCLYINLYKIKNMMKLYVKTLAGILFLAITLNTFFALIIGNFTGIAIATTITYYLWLIIGSRQFSFMKMTIMDYTYLSLYLIGFFSITRIPNDWIGMAVYFIFSVIIAVLFFRKDISMYLNKTRRKK